MMPDNVLLYFIAALIACFIGTIPFGPINLLVVKTTVDLDRQRGQQVAFSASLVEVGQALIAICFGMVISAFLESNVYIRMGIAVVFILLGVIIFFRKPSSKLNQGNGQSGSMFKKGLLIAAVNPQAVPFWIFALAAINQYFEFEYHGVYLAAFLLGVFAGKLLALSGFVLASTYLQNHLQESSLIVNRLLAAILVLIGISQAWRVWAV